MTQPYPRTEDPVDIERRIAEIYRKIAYIETHGYARYARTGPQLVKRKREEIQAKARLWAQRQALCLRLQDRS